MRGSRNMPKPTLSHIENSFPAHPHSSPGAESVDSSVVGSLLFAMEFWALHAASA
jgi:hypothetical protein